MDDFESFTMIDEAVRPGPHHLFDEVTQLTSGKTADHDLQYVVALRANNPGMIVTPIPAYNVPLRAFAGAGFATCELDTETDSFASWRGYSPPALRQNAGHLAESIHFAKYHYKWSDEDFILFTVGNMQYVLKECRNSETSLGPSKVTDKLIQTVGDWLLSDQEVVWVYDRYWMRSKALWNEVQKATWAKVIMDESMKAELANVTNKFFTSKAVYEDLGVPWKRGLLFYGAPGNGKTISTKALMHQLLDRKDPVPTLYVKSCPTTFDIRSVFTQARALAPCMLVLEDIETIVTAQTRSYFFNEMDGLENNDGLFVVGSTNFLERLDPGLSKRPSRFDRKYLFPVPNQHERELYCNFWRHKLESKPSIIFPKELCPEMARITENFSFAFLQECFVATLLIMARGETGFGETHFGKSGLDDYELWRTFKEQADILRKEVESQQAGSQAQATNYLDQNSAPTLESDARGLINGHSGSSLDRGYSHLKPTTLPDLRHLRVQDAVLPELPSYLQKRAYVNSAAFEYK